jgi:predicted enzyme related to lactoylglutathione lyase
MSSPQGQFVWHDLMTTDLGAAQSVYGGVVGWGTQPWQQDGSYTLWMAGEMPVGGCMALPAEVKAAGVPPHWLTYVGAQDVDATAAQAASLGGKVLKAPEDIPSVGRFAVLADPQGAVLCVYAPAPNLPPPSGAPSVGRFSRGTSWRRPIRARRSPSTVLSSAGERPPSTTWARRGPISYSTWEARPSAGSTPSRPTYRSPTGSPTPWSGARTTRPPRPPRWAGRSSCRRWRCPAAIASRWGWTRRGRCSRCTR